MEIVMSITPARERRRPRTSLARVVLQAHCTNLRVCLIFESKTAVAMERKSTMHGKSSSAIGELKWRTYFQRRSTKYSCRQ